MTSAHEITRRILDGRDGEFADRPETIQALPLVLRLEKTAQPPRDRLLAAAARACAALCFDERVATDPFWARPYSNWIDARVRKVARRARASKWELVQRVPGVTMVEMDRDGREVASARAFLPSPVNDVDPVLNKLQITGADLPVDINDEVPVPLSQAALAAHGNALGPNGQPDAGDSAQRAGSVPVPGHVVIYVDASLEMTVGKAAAQVAHGSQLMGAILSEDLSGQWKSAGFPLEVREVSGARFSQLRQRVMEAEDLSQVRWITRCGGDTQPMVVLQDAGHTEVAPGSATVIAEWVPAAR